MNDGVEDDDDDKSTNGNNYKNISNSANKMKSNSTMLNCRQIAFSCMQEFSKLAQNVGRTNKQGQNSQHQSKALLIAQPVNRIKLIGCVNMRNPFFLKPLLTVCATCVPRR